MELVRVGEGITKLHLLNKREISLFSYQVKGEEKKKIAELRSCDKK